MRGFHQVNGGRPRPWRRSWRHPANRRSPSMVGPSRDADTLLRKCSRSTRPHLIVGTAREMVEHTRRAVVSVSRGPGTWRRRESDALLAGEPGGPSARDDDARCTRNAESPPPDAPMDIAEPTAEPGRDLDVQMADANQNDGENWKMLNGEDLQKLRSPGPRGPRR